MTDGYYLSTYITIGELDNIYDISTRHDQNISLWHMKGDQLELTRYWELERYTGRKEHDTAFKSLQSARDFINMLLKEFDLTIADIVEIWGTPGLQTCNDYHSCDDYPEISYHSIAHLFSSLLSDTDIFQNNKMISFAIDGGPDNVIQKDAFDKSFYCGMVSDKGKIIDIFDVYSPGMMWISSRVCFNLKEGTLMALASASKSRLIMTNELELNIEEGENNFPKYEEYVKRIKEYVWNFKEKDAGILFNYFDTDFTEEENKISMVMKVVQEASHKIMDYEVDRIAKKYSIDPQECYLGMSGGFALNCPNNSKLIGKYKFKGFVSTPCVNDSGQSLGIALYNFYKHNQNIRFKLRNAYHGWNEKDIVSQINLSKYYDAIKRVEKTDMDTIIMDIQCSPIVWFCGNAEIGPRALGARSIIGDPREVKTKDKINEIKRRQWWRPVAPIILEDHINDWFVDAYASPYMLNALIAKEEKLGLIPAVLHLDNSARLQTVNQADNGDLYDLLTCFYQKTGVPVLCNTSLNDNGEPIINTIDEALNFAIRKKIYVIFADGYRIQLKEDYQIENRPEERGRKEFFTYSKSEEQELLQKLNPLDLNRNEIIQYRFNYLLHHLDITKEKDVKILKKFLKKHEHVYSESIRTESILRNNFSIWK